VMMGVSVKTQPHPLVLRHALEAGYVAECISHAELRAALEAGFSVSNIVLNGPAKWYTADQPEALGPKPGDSPIYAVFADSLADLRTIVQVYSDNSHWLSARHIGVRFAPTSATSRFGIQVFGDGEMLLEAAQLLSKLPNEVKIGVHFHYQCSTTGIEIWTAMARAVVTAAAFLAKQSGREVELLDLGGGWPAGMLEQPKTQAHVAEVLEFAQLSLPQLQAVMFEPGKGLTERAGALVTTVQEIREVKVKTKCDGGIHRQQLVRAAVVDAAISEMSSISTHPHPVLFHDDDNWRGLEFGADAVFGRICMEFDMLATNIKLPSEIATGNILLLAFCGAYDISMSYAFGDGRSREILEIE